MLPATARRVEERTSAMTNARIRQAIERSVIYHAQRPDKIDARLEQLEREWDIERVLELSSSTLALTGLTLALMRDRRWLALPIGVCAFMLQHALQGWCPPLPLLRRMGFRTAVEIDQERYALKALRGDFDASPRQAGSTQARARRAIEAAFG